jgi:hypothetical protein
MIRRGAPENVAMRISGHLTRSVFTCYDMIAGDDLRNAAKKMSGIETCGR